VIIVEQGFDGLKGPVEAADEQLLLLVLCL